MCTLESNAALENKRRWHQLTVLWGCASTRHAAVAPCSRCSASPGGCCYARCARPAPLPSCRPRLHGTWVSRHVLMARGVPAGQVAAFLPTWRAALPTGSLPLDCGTRQRAGGARREQHLPRAGVVPRPSVRLQAPRTPGGRHDLKPRAIRPWQHRQPDLRRSTRRERVGRQLETGRQLHAHEPPAQAGCTTAAPATGRQGMR